MQKAKTKTKQKKWDLYANKKASNKITFEEARFWF